MTVQLEDQIRESLAALAEMIEPDPKSGLVSASQRKTHLPPIRRLAAVAASLALVIGGTVVLARLGKDRQPAEGVASAVPSGVSDSGSAVLSTAADKPVEGFSWRLATDLGSVARSQVSAVVAGPNGFVATGVGFDDGKNQGRLWFSADGMTWEEPALSIFDTKMVSSPAVLNGYYFVLAQSNKDRLGMTEGTTGPADQQLFRSTNGRQWEPWGEVWGLSGSLAGTGNVLLRQRTVVNPVTTGPEIGALEWSRDGLDWHIATFGDESRVGEYFDLSTSGVVTHGSVAYLRGFDAQHRLAFWVSRDGINWGTLPEPPAGGPIVATADGLITISNPAADRCTTAELDGTSEPAADRRQCAGSQSVYQYQLATGEWRTLPRLDVLSVMWSPLLLLGDSLFAAVTDPEQGLSLATASIETYEWAMAPAPHLAYTNDPRSPGMAIAASAGTRAVVVTDDRRVEGKTAILVLTI